MSQIRLIAIDIDDTLVDDQRAIVPANASAIQDAMAAGVYVTLATGRMFASMEPYARELGLHPTTQLVAYNGALVRNLQGEQFLHHPVPKPIVIELAELARKNEATLNIYLDDRLYVDKINDAVAHYTEIAGIEANPVGDLVAFAQERLPDDGGSTKALMIFDPVEAEIWESRLQGTHGDQLEIMRSKPDFLELTAAGASKGEALRQLAASLGIKREEIMAIGDSYNDISMLEYAGLGVAVENAPELVRTVADTSVASNTAAGVAEAVQRFALR